jgi:hypothetical protein
MYCKDIAIIAQIWGKRNQGTHPIFIGKAVFPGFYGE